MKKAKVIKYIEYWFDGATTSYQVTKEDYYNSHFKGIGKFRLVTFDDNSQITCI